jgi:hypothetical protein
MREALEYNEPSMHGLNFSNPSMVQEAVKAVISSVAELAAEVSEHINNPKYIVVNGKTLQQSLEEGKWEKGDIKIHHGTWASAMAQVRKGWRICDGTFGTPQIHPRQGSSDLQRVPRGGAYGSNSGSTGGAATHTHTATMASHQHPINIAGGAQSAGAHQHQIPCSTNSLDNVCTTGSSQAAAHGHCHGGNTCSGGAHPHNVEGDTDSGGNCPITTAAGSSVQPVVDTIYLMWGG